MSNPTGFNGMNRVFHVAQDLKCICALALMLGQISLSLQMKLEYSQGN